MAILTFAHTRDATVLRDHPFPHRRLQVRPMVFGVAVGDRQGVSSLSGTYAPVSETLVVSR